MTWVSTTMPTGDLERVREDDVRGLAADAGERGQLVHRARHFAAVAFDDRLRGGDHRLRLVAEEAGLLDVALHLHLTRRSRTPAAFGYLRKSDLVTMFTRTSVDCAESIVAISSSNGVREIERALRLRVHLFEACDDVDGALLFLRRHGRFD